jgi:hypothetical protein
MSDSTTDILLNRFPFLTLCRCGKNEYVGIVQNIDVNIISLYSFDIIRTTNEKLKFIEYGNEWWWGTNRQIPINIVLGEKFNMFNYCLVSFTNKDFEIISGPTVSLRNLLSKRLKKKSIQLVKKINNDQ